MGWVALRVPPPSRVTCHHIAAIAACQNPNKTDLAGKYTREAAWLVEINSCLPANLEATWFDPRRR